MEQAPRASMRASLARLASVASLGGWSGPRYARFLLTGVAWYAVLCWSDHARLLAVPMYVLMCAPFESG